MRDLGFDEVVGWSFTDPGEAGRLRIPAEDPRASAVVIANPLSEDQSVMRTTLLGSLLDVARAQPRPRRRARRPVRVRPRLPAADGRERRAASRVPFAGERGRRRSTSRTGSAASRSAPLAPGSWRGGGRARPTSSRSRASLEALAARLGVATRLRGRPSEPFLHPGRCGRRSSVAGGRRGLDRRAPPARLPRLGPRRRASASKSTSAPLVAASPAGEEIYEDVTTFPAVLQDLAVVVEDSVPAAEVRDAVARGRRRAAALGRGLRPLRGRAARRGTQEPGAAARVPRRRPHPHRRGGRRPARRRSPPGSARSGGRSVNEPRRQPLDGDPAARVLVAGASGFTGALAAQTRLAPPAARAGRGHLAQRRRQPARRPLPALPGAARADRARPRRARGDRRRDRRLPARRLGADRRRPARPRRARRRPLRRLPPARPARPTSAGTGSTARPSCSRAPSTA